MKPGKPNGAQEVTPQAQTKQPLNLPCDHCCGHSPGVCAPLGDEGVASLVAETGQRHWEKRQLLYRGHGAADAFYKITKGIVAEFEDFPDGRRQIVAIRTVGDFCGYPPRKGRYVFTSQAITPVDACAFGAEQFRANMVRDADFACAVADKLSERLNLALIRLTVVGQFNSLERVAHFIVDMMERLPSRSIYSEPVALHLTRQEIAEYLGLKLETVSRAFSKLKQMRLIALSSADVVVILDQKRLCEIGSGRL